MIAIYVENKGDIWIPATGFNETNVPKDVIDEVYDDKNFNERTSMITYFIEDGTYTLLSTLNSCMTTLTMAFKVVKVNSIGGMYKC